MTASAKEVPMPADRGSNRREFMKAASWGSLAVTAGMVATGRTPAFAAAPSKYPDWIPASPKPPRRGGTLTRASAWDPPVIDPRLTQSVGLYQFAGLTSNRLVRYAFTDEATGANDLSLKGDLAESWTASPDHRVWTFKLRQGVRWQNVPPLNGRDLVAADVKYCFEAYAREGVQAFTFQEIEGMETPDKYTLRVHLHTSNVLVPQNQPGDRRAVMPQPAGALRPGSRAGPTALQRRAGPPRGVDGHRPPEAGRHRVRGPRHRGVGGAVHLLSGPGADGEGPRPVVA